MKKFLTAAALVALTAAPTVFSVEPDNTALNERDRSVLAKTADQQSNVKSDIDITAQIRRTVVADKGLSTKAHNVKIITDKGLVTLKGPVADVHEKRVIGSIASRVAGRNHVVNNLDVLKSE
jgi:hyperosmotically inducible protein